MMDGPRASLVFTKIPGSTLVPDLHVRDHQPFEAALFSSPTLIKNLSASSTDERFKPHPLRLLRVGAANLTDVHGRALAEARLAAFKAKWDSECFENQDRSWDFFVSIVDEAHKFSPSHRNLFTLIARSINSEIGILPTGIFAKRIRLEIGLSELRSIINDIADSIQSLIFEENYLSARDVVELFHRKLISKLLEQVISCSIICRFWIEKVPSTRIWVQSWRIWTGISPPANFVVQSVKRLATIAEQEEISDHVSLCKFHCRGRLQPTLRSRASRKCRAESRSATRYFNGRHISPRYTLWATRKAYSQREKCRTSLIHPC